MPDASFNDMLGLDEEEVIAKDEAISNKEVSFDEMISTPKKVAPIKEEPKPKPKPKTFSGGGLEAVRIPGVVGFQTMYIPKKEPTEPGTIGKFVKGAWESSIGGLNDIVDSAYDLWKKGDLSELVKLSSNLLTGGFVNIDPSKGVTEGGLSSETGRNLIEAGKSAIEGKPAKAVVNITEAIPFIGTMIEGMNNLLDQGELAEGLGFGVGTVVGIKVGSEAHQWIRKNAAKAKAITTSKIAEGKPIEQAVSEARVEVADEIIKEVAKNKTTESSAKINKARIKPPKGSVAEVTENAKRDLESIKLMRRRKLAQAKSTPVEIPDTSKIDMEIATSEMIEKAREITERKTAEIAEPITELDLQTGTPEPEVMSTENHPLRQPGSSVYQGNKSVASNMEEALNNLPDRPIKDPNVTAQSLITEVNRWLDGEEVDIEGTRDFLSNLATHADEFRYKFAGSEGYPQSFLEFKSLLEDASEWARRSDRTKIGRSIDDEIVPETLPGKSELIVTSENISEIEKYFGKDLDEIPDVDIENFMKGERPKVEKRVIKELPEEDITPEELAELEPPDRFEKKKVVKEEKPVSVDELTGKIVKKVKDIESKKDKVEEVIRTPEEEVELARLISEQDLDATTERFARRRRTRTSLNFGLPLDEAGKIMKDWYSALRVYAEEKLGNRASGQQIKNTLRKASTSDEWKTVGLDELLEDGKTYTKEEVLKKIDEGTVEFKDVMLSDNGKYRYDDSGNRVYNEPKFSTYQEPGGSNYKELFVTAPSDRTMLAKEYYGDFFDELSSDVKKSYIDEMPNSYQGSFRWQDGHSDYSDIENPIVRLRMNDRVDAQGNKVLFIEELQGPNPENQAKMPEALRKRIREVGMKRAIKYAIDNGYDKVAWTTGEMQANRYSLDSYISNLVYGKNIDKTGKQTGTYYLTSEGNGTFDVSVVLKEDLEKYVGKDIAQKILNNEGAPGKNIEYDERILEKVDLKVEEKGLRKLYDQDLPNVAKKLGGKVESVDINIYPQKNDFVVANYGEYFQVRDKTTAESYGPEFKTLREAEDYLRDFKFKNKIEYKTESVPSVSIAPLKPKATKGFSLYSGIPIDKLAEETINLAKSISEYTTKAHEMKGLDLRKSAKVIREEFNKAFIDRSGNIRSDFLNQLGDTGYNIIQKMYLSKGASARATNELKQMRREVYNGLDKDEKKILDDLILDIRMIDISKYKTEKQFKFPKPIEAFQLHEKLFGKKSVNKLKDLSPEKIQELRTRAKGYYEWMKKPLKEMYEEGLLSETEYNDLLSHNYRRIGTVESPIMLADLLDKKYETKIGDSKRTIYDSGIEKLARGRTADIYEPSSEIMALETFNRSYGRIMNNQANRTLLDLARNDPKNNFVRFKGEDKTVKIPSGFVRHFVYEGGERKSIWLSPELSKEWITLSKDVSPRVAQVLRYASLSPVTRLFATGIEWSFALANIPRDVMHLWYASRYFENGKWNSIYSSHSPVFAAQLSHDLASVASDALLRKGRFNDYIKDGGGMDFLVHQARPFQKGLHLEGPIEHAYNFLGYLNETSEIITRLAIRERMLRKGKSSTEATFSARDYMDFSQGGWASKTADNFIPYLNASIQGTRGLVRSFKGGTGLANTYKLAQFGTAVVGIYLAMKDKNPKTYEAIKNDPNGQNNFIIPLGDQFGFIDDKGQMRYPYLKIPLDPGQKFFKKFFEASTDKWLGEEVDVDGTVSSLKEMSPVGISSLPATVSGAIGYLYNKDLWRDRNVTKQTFPWPDSKEEFGVNTPTIAKQVGQLVGVSPDRIKFVVNELIANSMWGDIVGGAYEKVFGNMPKDKKEQHLAQAISKYPIIKRFLGLTNPYSKFADKANEIEQKATLERFVENRNFDLRVDGYVNQGTITWKEVHNFIGQQRDKDTRDRMRSELKFAERAKGLPNLSFWMRMKGMPNLEARAKFYLYRKNKATSPEEKAALFNEERQVNRIGGILTDEFRKEVRKVEMEK